MVCGQNGTLKGTAQSHVGKEGFRIAAGHVQIQHLSLTAQTASGRPWRARIVEWTLVQVRP